jgi:hypothetical protein
MKTTCDIGNYFIADVSKIDLITSMKTHYDVCFYFSFYINGKEFKVEYSGDGAELVCKKNRDNLVNIIITYGSNKFAYIIYYNYLCRYIFDAKFGQFFIIN